MDGLLTEEGVRVEIDETHRVMLEELMEQHGEDEVRNDLTELVQRTIYESRYEGG